jgi:hypothetical protein
VLQLSLTPKHAHTYLATGPCFMLYNGMLRGFGNCGEVPASVEFGSPEFWNLLGIENVADRMRKAGHKFSSTMHALASGIKKIQATAEDGQGTRLFRGLGKLLHSFLLHLYASWELFVMMFWSWFPIRWAGRSAVHGGLRLYRDGIHVVDPRFACRA